jgi:hypothetical protein
MTNLPSIQRKVQNKNTTIEISRACGGIINIWQHGALFEGGVKITQKNMT